MDHFDKLKRQLSSHNFLMILACNSVVIGLWVVGIRVLHLNVWAVAVIVGVLATTGAWLVALLLRDYAVEPIRFIWEAALHVSPNHTGTAAPNLEKSRLGRELVTSLCLEIYQLASTTSTTSQSTSTSGNDTAQTVLATLPLPTLLIDKTGMVTYANARALQYVGIPVSEVIGKEIYGVLDLSFANENTLESWIADCQANKVTDTRSWDRVRLKLKDQEQLKQLDMAATYMKDSPTGVEAIITLFDHSERYNQDDMAMSYVAIAVHELRAPLTILRGYIEAIEEELEGKLDAQLTDFLHKMKASAEQLAAFVNNILNVARIDDNQLTLQLNEEDWPTVLTSTVEGLSLRAQVHGKKIECKIAGNLPTVAVDRISIYEVLNNLVDNAIKYSGDSQTIAIHSELNGAGLIETTVQDFGIGIPANVLPNLFSKFYRNHRTRAQIGGTGLGLYLCKAIVTAHGGNITVQSKEGHGSSFSFTLQPYSQVASDRKNNDNDLVRSAHGWIKNHTLYRR